MNKKGDLRGDAAVGG